MSRAVRKSFSRAAWLAGIAVTAWVAAGGLTTARGSGAPPVAPSASVEPPPAAAPPEEAAVPPESTDFPVPPPPITEGYFPCSGCHADLKTNPQPRELQDEHTDIKLNHGPRERWCFDCHDPNNRDQLHLASGAPVPFTASYRLCGQCHGDKYRDWRVGVHGKRTGSWDGPKRYLLCANCHNPHSPHFAPLEPLPPPVPPAAIQ